MIALLHGVYCIKECKCNKCIQKAIDKVHAEAILADVCGRKLMLLNYVFVDIDEDTYNIRSEYLYKLVFPNKQEEGNLWHKVRALGMGNSAFDQHKYILVGDVFTYCLPYKCGVAEAHRRCHKSKGTKTATFYQHVVMHF